MSLKKKVIIASIFFLAMMIAFWTAFFYFRGLNRALPSAEPTPIIIPTPTPTLLPQSPYATDSAILEIKEGLKNLEKELDSLDLKEPLLLPPVLDLEVDLPQDSAP